jgi:hypothetical protein
VVSQKWKGGYCIVGKWFLHQINRLIIMGKRSKTKWVAKISKIAFHDVVKIKKQAV